MMSPEQKRARIKWVLNHPMWEGIFQGRLHQEMDRYFGEGRDITELLNDRDPTHYKDISYSVGGFEAAVDVEYVYVNPETMRIEEDDALNTLFQVWIEAGPLYNYKAEGHREPDGGWHADNQFGKCHDPHLDVSGETIEEALLALADKVEKFYHDDGTSREGVDE